MEFHFWFILDLEWAWTESEKSHMISLNILKKSEIFWKNWFQRDSLFLSLEILKKNENEKECIGSVSPAMCTAAVSSQSQRHPVIHCDLSVAMSLGSGRPSSRPSKRARINGMPIGAMSMGGMPGMMPNAMMPGMGMGMMGPMMGMMNPMMMGMGPMGAMGMGMANANGMAQAHGMSNGMGGGLRRGRGMGGMYGGMGGCMADGMGMMGNMGMGGMCGGMDGGCGMGDLPLGDEDDFDDGDNIDPGPVANRT